MGTVRGVGVGLGVAVGVGVTVGVIVGVTVRWEWGRPSRPYILEVLVDLGDWLGVSFMLEISPALGLYGLQREEFTVSARR